MDLYELTPPLWDEIKSRLNQSEWTEVQRILGFDLINVNQVYLFETNLFTLGIVRRSEVFVRYTRRSSNTK